MKNSKYYYSLLSILGASIIGLALGVVFYNYLTDLAYILLIIGVIAHGIGMYKARS